MAKCTLSFLPPVNMPALNRLSGPSTIANDTLESQVRAAQQKLYDLRRKLPDAGSATGARTPLDVVQHALALFWPSAAGINTAGTSEAQLKYERQQLTRDIDIVEQQQQAAQRAEAADSASTEVQALPAAPPTTQPQPAPAPAPAASVQSPSSFPVPVNPLHLQRAAALPAPVAWWPAALAGCLCGLLYWGIAIARYRALRDSDDELDDEDDEVDLPEKSTRSMYGLSGIDAPVRAASRDEWIEAYPAETSLPKHASFSFDQESDSASASDQRSDQPPSPEPIQHSTEDTVPDDMPEPGVAPSQTDKPETASDAGAVAPPRTPEEQDEVSQEEHDQETCPGGTCPGETFPERHLWKTKSAEIFLKLPLLACWIRSPSPKMLLMVPPPRKVPPAKQEILRRSPAVWSADFDPWYSSLMLPGGHRPIGSCS